MLLIRIQSILIWNIEIITVYKNAAARDNFNGLFHDIITTDKCNAMLFHIYKKHLIYYHLHMFQHAQLIQTGCPGWLSNK